MTAANRIFITGANGFVGSEIIRALRGRGVSGSRVVAVVRAKHGNTPRQRMDQVFARWVRAGADRQVASLAHFGDAIDVVEWDALPQILMGESGATIIHAAADTAFDLPIAESRRINVGLTESLLRTIAEVGSSSVARFIYVSTAFVCGKRLGLIPEGGDATEVRPASDFHNSYEQSKFEGEQLLRRVKPVGRQPLLPWVIVRPGIVVGDSRSGFTLHFRVIYSVVRLWLRDVVPRAPIARDARIDVVPSNFVAAAIVRLCDLSAEQIAGRTLHLCSGNNAPGPIDVMAAAGRAFGRKPLPLSPPWVLRFLLSRPILALCSHGMREILTTLAWHVPYLGSRGRVFDTSVAREVLGQEFGVCPEFCEYGDRIFDYCAQTSWGHRCSTSI